MKIHPLSTILSLDEGKPYRMVSHYEDAGGAKIEHVTPQMVNSGQAKAIEEPITLGKALTLACDQPAKEATPKALLERITMQARIQKAIRNKTTLDLTSEQVTSLKELVATGIQPVSLAGLICEALEGHKEIEGITFLVVPEAPAPAKKGGK